MARRKKPVHISTREAMRRLKRMIRAITRDVQIAMEVEASLEAANAIVTAAPTRKRPGAETYMATSNALTMYLALCVARIFDQGSARYPDNKKDLASLPLMIRLLRQRRCQAILIDRARRWTPGFPQDAACQRAIGEAIDRYRAMRRSSTDRASVRRLRNFRNEWLAHTMMDDPAKKRPAYKDLFRLIDVAREIVQPARLAILGEHHDLPEIEELYMADAKRFWEAALK
jgi:hypothetical protein